MHKSCFIMDSLSHRIYSADVGPVKSYPVCYDLLKQSNPSETTTKTSGSFEVEIAVNRYPAPSEL